MEAAFIAGEYTQTLYRNGAENRMNPLFYDKSNKDNCRFLFTVNDIRKISEALRSRLKQICFDISPVDQASVVERLVARYETKLPELCIKYDPKRLRELVGIYFPDLRSIANQVEFEFA
jgi:DNA polymerase III delta prime subunit